MQNLLTIAKALSDESRIRVLLALQTGELCVCQIVELLGLAPSTVSKHMAVLAQAGLVQFRKQGLWRYYRLPDAATSKDVQATMAWVSSLSRSSSAALADRRRVKSIRKMELQEVCGCYKN